MIWDETTKI